MGSRQFDKWCGYKRTGNGKTNGGSAGQITPNVTRCQRVFQDCFAFFLKFLTDLTVCCLCCLLSPVCCLLSAVCYLPSAVCCLLSAVCCLLSAVCCLLVMGGILFPWIITLVVPADIQHLHNAHIKMTLHLHYSNSTPQTIHILL